MSEQSIIDGLRAAGWDDVSIRFSHEFYFVTVAKKEWYDGDYYQSLRLPQGGGETLEEAVAQLKGAIKRWPEP